MLFHTINHIYREEKHGKVHNAPSLSPFPMSLQGLKLIWMKYMLVQYEVDSANIGGDIEVFMFSPWCVVASCHGGDGIVLLRCFLILADESRGPVSKYVAFWSPGLFYC